MTLVHPPVVHVCNKLQFCRTYYNSWKNMRKIIMFENCKKNEEIMVWISSSSLIPVYMTYTPIVHVCTKFQLCRPYHSSGEKCDENFNVWQLERKNIEEIKGWQSSSSSLNPVYTIHPLIVHVFRPKLKKCKPHSSREKRDETFNIWKLERKMLK